MFYPPKFYKRFLKRGLVSDLRSLNNGVTVTTVTLEKMQSIFCFSKRVSPNKTLTEFPSIIHHHSSGAKGLKTPEASLLKNDRFSISS